MQTGRGEVLETSYGAMMRGPSRVSTFSSSTSLSRGFTANTAGSESSSATAICRPLEPEDVVIEITLNGSTTNATGQSLLIERSETHIVIERSFFIVPLTVEGKQIRRPCHPPAVAMEDIIVAVNCSPEEGLLFGSSVLKSDEIELVTSWLVENYSLASLQRISVQIFQDLQASQVNNPRLAESLEQRAHVVAEASGRRATQEAEADTANSGGGLRRTTKGITASTRDNANARIRNAESNRQKKVTLMQEKQSIEDTLQQFNQKIAMFSKEDPATAEMLMPAKLDLEGKLRHLRAQLASLGATESEHSGASCLKEPSQQEHKDRDDPMSPTNEYVADSFTDDTSDDSSDDYDTDCKMALPIEGSEYDVPFVSNASGRDGYISSSSDETLTQGAPLGNKPSSGAEYVIDLGQIQKKLSVGSDSGNTTMHDRKPDDETLYICKSPVLKSDFYTASTFDI